MTLIDRERLVCIGRVGAAHGLAGELKVKALAEDAGYYETLQELYLDTPHGLRQARVEALRVHGSGWLLKVAGIEDRTAAEGVKGALVLVAPEQIKPLAPGEYFTRDLVGCEVMTAAGLAVGKVREVLDTPANPVLEIHGAAGEVLVPLVAGIVVAVDIAARRVTIDPPPGMVPEPEPPDGPKRIEVLTLFPELFGPFLKEGLIGRAMQNGLLAVETLNFRGHGLGRHRQVDDVPYGGGAGMVLRPEPLFAAVRERREANRARGKDTWVVLLTPQGRPFRQADAAALARRKETLVFVCGRYEGFDERARTLADDELSLGDFVTLGGEAPAMAMIEAVSRLVPGVLGNPESCAEESFAGGRLEYPQYTRPPEFEGLKVPDVLLSGNHGEIARWRKEQARERTALRRPDLTGRETRPAAATDDPPHRAPRGRARRNRSRES
jgi:tRNA (guanine37-N1)-methyltransferase